MYKKLITILLIIVFLPSCKETKTEESKISKLTEDVMLNRTSITYNEVPIDE